MSNNRFLVLNQTCQDAIKAFSFYLLVFSIPVLAVLYVCGFEINCITISLPLCFFFLLVLITFRYANKKKIAITENGIILLQRKQSQIQIKKIKWIQLDKIVYCSQCETGIQSNKELLYLHLKRQWNLKRSEMIILEINLRQYLPFSAESSQTEYINGILEPLCKRKNVLYWLEVN